MSGQVLLGCHFCGEMDVVTVEFSVVDRQAVDVVVREEERMERFWRIHLEPYAKAAS